MWCCIGFKAGYDSAGQRGTGYLIGRDSLDAPEFILQFRAVDKGEESHIQSDISASVVMDIRIVFCPSCGVNLEEFYRKHIDSLHREGLEVGFLKQN